jgi:uncharacterized membrane protein
MVARSRAKRSPPPSRTKRRHPWRRIMPRHAPFYFGIALGAITGAISLWLVPKYAISLASNVLFITFLLLTAIKLPHLTSSYLHQHAREEDTPVGGIFLVLLIVVAATIVTLFISLADGRPDPWEVTASLSSVLLGWFTVQIMAALHYAYEYYEADDDVGDQYIGGLGFKGGDDPDAFDFMYFSFTIGTSVATSDTDVESGKMRRIVAGHLVFSHLYNTLILASAVNVMLSLGGQGG